MSPNIPTAYLTRRIVFSASHRLYKPDWSDEKNFNVYGKCSHVHGHGHNYILYVTVVGAINAETGMVMDLSELKTTISHLILTEFDHKHLNFDVPEFKTLVPTAENIVYVLWNKIVPLINPHKLFELKLEETENNIITYRG